MYLKTEMGCNFNTGTKFLQNLKRITCLAIRHGWLLKDPFAGISLTMKEVDRPYLNEEELLHVENLYISRDRINRVQDFFIFSFYTGLAYADVKKLKRSEIERFEGRMWIRTKRQKTGGMTNVPLLSKPVQRASDAMAVINPVTKDCVTIIGFSDGDYTAYKIGAMYPDRVRKMIVIGAGELSPGIRAFQLTSSQARAMDKRYREQQLKLMPEPNRLEEIFTQVAIFIIS